jgi:hypothetical protein
LRGTSRGIFASENWLFTPGDNTCLAVKGDAAASGGITLSTFAADIDQLTTLGATLGTLATEAGELAVDSSLTSASTMRSVIEANDISAVIVAGSLLPTITERLGETGESMTAVAIRFQGQEDSHAQKLATTSTNATGDWNTGADS